MGEQDSKDKVLIVEKRLIMNSVGEIIATNRKRLGWSQTELAEPIKPSPNGRKTTLSPA